MFSVMAPLVWSVDATEVTSRRPRRFQGISLTKWDSAGRLCSCERVVDEHLDVWSWPG